MIFVQALQGKKIMPNPAIRSIEYDDIQLVRYWRNLDHVRSKLIQQNTINRDQQRNWFEKLNTDKSKYFIYSLDNIDIGVVSITNINSEALTFEGGIFCGNPHFLGHWINVWACIQIYEKAFFDLQLQTSLAVIIEGNNAAISLNKALGYKPIESDSENINKFILTKESFLKNTGKIKQFIESNLN